VSRFNPHPPLAKRATASGSARLPAVRVSILTRLWRSGRQMLLAEDLASPPVSILTRLWRSGRPVDRCCRCPPAGFNPHPPLAKRATISNARPLRLTVFQSSPASGEAGDKQREEEALAAEKFQSSPASGEAGDSSASR